MAWPDFFRELNDLPLQSFQIKIQATRKLVVSRYFHGEPQRTKIIKQNKPKTSLLAEPFFSLLDFGVLEKDSA